MSILDEEEIDVPQNNPKGGDIFKAEKTQLNIIKDRNTAPLEECDFKVMIQLSGIGPVNDQMGVDIVTVLDVSGSMEREGKLTKMKTGMLFLINKLRPVDRLSIIKFSDGFLMLCNLRKMTENFKVVAEGLVKALVAGGLTNIHDGLEAGINVLKGRKSIVGRTVGILLMSDGAQTSRYKDAADVELGGVPVHTFGFGLDHKPGVMEKVAAKTTGGTYSSVQQDATLCVAFSKCLAGLLTVIVEDLKLIITPIDCTIKEVIAGKYNITTSDDSQTIEFGSLYSKEIRNTIVHLCLPAVKKDEQDELLEVTYSYSEGGKVVEADPSGVFVRRTGTYMEMEGGDVELKIEECRLRISEMISDARRSADENLDEAQEKLDDALNILEDEFDDPIPPMIKSLKSEVKEFMNLLVNPDTYTKQGEGYALSSSLSHSLQRHATRGNEDLDLFETPRMKAYGKQAKKFEKCPDQPPPSVEDDVKEELAADPLANVRGPLSYHIRSLNAVEEELAADPLANVRGRLSYHIRSLNAIIDILDQKL